MNDGFLRVRNFDLKLFMVIKLEVIYALIFVNWMGCGHAEGDLFIVDV